MTSRTGRQSGVFRMNSTSKRGFTLIELMVVVGMTMKAIIPRTISKALPRLASCELRIANVGFPWDGPARGRRLSM